MKLLVEELQLLIGHYNNEMAPLEVRENDPEYVAWATARVVRLQKELKAATQGAPKPKKSL